MRRLGEVVPHAVAPIPRVEASPNYFLRLEDTKSSLGAYIPCTQPTLGVAIARPSYSRPIHVRRSVNSTDTVLAYDPNVRVWHKKHVYNRDDIFLSECDI